MASCNEDFNQYHEFLQNIAKSVNNHDSEVPVKLTSLRNSYYASDTEGEVIYWMLKFLNEKKCPTKLTAPILRNALIEIQNNSHYKDPKREGLHNLRALTMNILEGFCVRLKDNVELNKILDTATSRSAQQFTDDLLTIPIRTAGACINRRSKMEDRSICIDEFHQVYRTKDPQKSSFYGVFDGHNGYVAAQYAAVQLPYNLSVHTDDPIISLRQVFEYTDKQFVEFKLPGGTTVTCALYRPEERRLYVAWVGDSKAMLAKKHGKIMQLVTPHRLDLESEKKRIQLSGGTVHCVQGEYRVNGCINLTRSIGDASMKRQLIGTPDCVVVELDKQEEFLVLATDGLFDHASDCDIARTVYDCIKEDCENLDQIPDRLIKLAQDGKSTDNISVIVVFFKHPSQIAKNCENLTIMESEFDNIKQADYYSSTNYYASEEETTTTSPTIVKQMRWGRDDDMNNIINEEVKQTTMTTTTTTTTSTNNGQFDDNLLYCSDNMNLSQKIQSTVDDDNILHRDATMENNGDEFLAAGYSNKNELPTEYDNDQQKILEKNHANPQLADTDADYGPETCVDVTDDVVMMTENSADTNNLLEQSTLSHSKDTLPSSDNCNPFDNKNVLDMEDTNEYQLGGGIGGVDAHLQLDDANKSTPLLSPEVEDLPLSSDGGLQFTNEGFQQSPLDEEMPVGLESHQQQQVDFEDEFAKSNGHLSPQNESKDSENFIVTEQLEKSDVPLKTDELEDIENLGKLQELDEDNLMKDEEISSSQQQVDFATDFLGSLQQPQEIVQQNDNIYDNLESNDNDESDFRLKDEEEILEKHVEASFGGKEREEIEDAELDLDQRDELQQTLHNLEDDILEEKPILTGSFTEKQSTEINFDAMSMQPEEEKLSDFADEKQNREEFSEKESKVDEVLEKLSFVEQKSAPSEDIELEEDECIHLEEDVRPSDYLAMLERQKEEQQQLSKVVEGFERDIQDEDIPEKLDQPNIKEELEEDEGISESVDLLEKEELLEKVDNLEKPIFDEDDRLSDKVEQLAKEQNDRLSDTEEEQYGEDKLIEQPEEVEKLQPKEDQQIDNKKEEIIEKDDEHFDEDLPLSVETEQHEQERHLHDIEIMSQQFDRMEDAEQAEDRLNDQIEQEHLLEDERLLTEPLKNENLYDDDAALNEQIGQLEEIQRELELNENKEELLNQDAEKLDSEFTPLTEPDNLVEGFEPIEKLVEEILPQQENQEQPKFREESLAEELENKLLEDDFIEEPEKQLLECTEKQLAKIEAQVLDLTPIPAERPKRETKPEEDFEIDYENMVEVVEEPIIKEQVPIKPSTLPVTSQEPSAVSPTPESCDELENNEWKYMKEGQGEKQLLDLQGVVEEALHQKSQEDISAFSIEEKTQPSAAALTEQISSIATEQAESIKDTFENLTQNIADLAESAAAIADTTVDKVESTLESLNLSQSSTREKLDNIDDEDLSASEMNSKLNPEAKEFVPTFSPTATIELANGFGIAAPTAIPQHFRDELLAQSPRKGRESDMEDINIPAENEFEEEIAHKPHGLPNDEAIVEQPENGGLYQEMNWKEAMHGSEKEEGPLVDSPLTEESLEVVDNALQYAADPNLLGFTAPVDLDNAGMKESIYIENNTIQDSNEEDILNTVQVLPVEDSESKDNSFELLNASSTPALQEKDVVTKEEVQEILTLVSDEKKGNKVDEEIEQRMKELLLSHDNEITKEVQHGTEFCAINGVEMFSASHEIGQSVPQQLQEPSAPALVEGLALGAVAAAAVATTTAAVKKVEAEKNQKNLIKTSATKSKVPDTKKPTAGLTSKTSTVSSASAKRSLGSDKPKSTVTSSLVTKKTPATTTAGAPRPRTAPAAAKVPADKKTTSTTSTTTTSTAKSRIDTKPSTTLTSRKPLTSSASKANKYVEEPKSSSTTVKSSVSSKTTLASKSSSGASKPALTTHSITKPRPATASSATTTNGVATKTAAPKPTTLAPKSAANSKPSLTSPRGTLTSTLRKTEAIKSPTKSTTSTITSRVSSTNGTKSTTTTTRTTTSKTTSSTVPTAAARTTSTTTRRPTTGTTSTIGATTPTSKTNNLVPRKSTPLKKTSNSSTPTARRSIGSKLNASATKPTKDTSTPRPVTIPAHHQQNHEAAKAAAELIKDVPVDNGEPKMNGIASSPDDVPSPTAPVALPLEVEIA